MRQTNMDLRLEKELKDPYFRELYELEMQKVALIKPILEYRVRHKINQKELAKRAGVSQQHISKIENGDFSNLLTLEKVLLYVGYTVRFKAVPLKPSVSRQIISRSIPTS